MISLCVPHGSLVRRPVELGSIDPHAVQNNRELARDGDLGLAEAVSLWRAWLPKPSAVVGLQNLLQFLYALATGLGFGTGSSMLRNRWMALTNDPLSATWTG